MIQNKIKAFCIDFNWDGKGHSAPPGMYIQADPEEHVRWYADLGANVIQTFCVAYNGFAWYQGNVVPWQPGLDYDFLKKVVDLAHQRNMKVMGYFCLGANPRWEAEHAELYHAEMSGSYRIPFTEQYLDFFCESVQDALIHSDIDGFMIDWFNVPRRARWLDCEKQMYREMMGEVFPSQRELPATGILEFDRQSLLPFEEQLEFDRRSLNRAWQRIRAAVQDIRSVIIWTNHPFRTPDDPLWTNHSLLREVDWVLNEGANVNILPWLEKQVGSHTRIIQNLCGWANHDATIWKEIDTQRFGLYGFAQADPQTTLPLNDGTEAAANHQKNIRALRQAYHEI